MKLRIMDVELNLETTQQLRPVLENYFQSTQLHTICEVSMRMLMMARREEEIKNILNGYDLSLPGEVEILLQGNVKELKLAKEIKDNSFFTEFMNLIVGQKRKLYLLGETEYQINELKQYIYKKYPEALICGEGWLNDGKELFALINEINIQTPDAILSVIPSPDQEYFVRDRRNMLDTKVWYGLNGNYRINSPTRRIGALLKNFVQRLSFKEFIARYHKEKEEK